MKKGEIWMHRNKDNIIDSILYVIDPSWSMTKIWCWMAYRKDDCQVEYLKDKKPNVIFYSKNDILKNPHWQLVDSLEVLRWICGLYADLCAIKQEKAVCEEDTQSKISELLNENKKLKDSISCAADKQEGILVFLKDGSERLIKSGVRHAFDSINDMFYVMDKEDETIAGFESDFVRGFMPVNRRQQRCD